MLTTKTRINISLSKESTATLKKLAIRDQVPTATTAARLLEEALEIQEDEVLDRIASERGKMKKVRYLTHKEVWGRDL